MVAGEVDMDQTWQKTLTSQSQHVLLLQQRALLPLEASFLPILTRPPAGVLFCLACAVEVFICICRTPSVSEGLGSTSAAHKNVDCASYPSKDGAFSGQTVEDFALPSLAGTGIANVC